MSIPCILKYVFNLYEKIGNYFWDNQIERKTLLKFVKHFIYLIVLGQANPYDLVLLRDPRTDSVFAKDPFCFMVLLGSLHALGLAECFVGESIKKTMIHTTCR